MIRHYLKVAFRNLQRQKVLSYRIDVGYLVFVIAGLLTLSIALVTVSFQAIKAGISNPVKSLRTE